MANRCMQDRIYRKKTGIGRQACWGGSWGSKLKGDREERIGKG